MTAEQKGIEQTKELVIGLNELLVLLASVLKDGFQAKDAAEVWAKVQANPELSAKLLAAYNKIEEVPLELKDISMVEGFELAGVQIKYLPELVQIISKK